MARNLNKRKADEEIEDINEIENVPSPADKADLLRMKLLAYKSALRHRVYKRPTIAINAINSSRGASSFFESLPREIRDTIYGYVWTSTPTILQRYRRKEYFVSYGDQDLRCDDKDWEHWSAPWLLTNKQMLLEGLAEFHQQSFWHFKTESHAVLKPSEYTFPLITPGLVRTHHLHIGWPSSGDFAQRTNVDSQTPFDPSKSVAIERYFWLKKDVITLVNCMMASMEMNEVVREIKVTVVILKDIAGLINYRGMLQHPIRYVFDLSQLERLAVHRGLREFQARIEVRMPRQPASTVELAKASSSLIGEFQRVGTLLVDGVWITSINEPFRWEDTSPSLLVGEAVCTVKKP
ncbi:uncharacterized protein K460DRAFT_403089 [Cucurbitaria berberidis CBS 394.84]|uniref:Uncharacterized protein n=1 Tax=Cucurbitaria berberidis CBS 394.84 TaxID=1168544 RepID=A0A9P4LAQ7_9PLEO|nr:uncharacterized protein K460DRAFT_403089 [Cucurbitaria berberidis CBS 394.84]KAF1847763.1 hypothetical protein K460DRAFT_403089 [Cucurbitaria berberidis CBS 394.84]